MKSIIVAYPKKNSAMHLRNVLENDGLYVSHICATGASVLGIAADLRSGVIITAAVLSDMSAAAMAERLPSGFDVIALSPNGSEDYMGNLITLPLPLDREDFLKTTHTLVATETSFTNRDGDDRQIISKAKTIIMNTRHMTEMQAHKYLQSQSMKSSKKMADIAKEILERFD